MSLALAGKDGKVKIDSNEISYLNNWKASVVGAELDTTKFGDTDKRRQIGIKSMTGSATGVFASGDTTGQDTLWTAYQARTVVALVLLVDGTNGFTTSAIITKLSIADDVNGVATANFDFEVDGKPTISTF